MGPVDYIPRNRDNYARLDYKPYNWVVNADIPPRLAFLDFPLGHTTGKPRAPDLQRQILVEALSSFETMTAPGSMKELPFRWPMDEEDRRRAEQAR